VAGKFAGIDGMSNEARYRTALRALD